MRYLFIKENRSLFPVTKVCQALDISPSGYYRWCKNPLSIRSIHNERLKERIHELYSEHNGMAGSPMITADLRAEDEFPRVGKNRVARLMSEMNLKCKTIKKYVATTDSKHNEPVAPNLLNREFAASTPPIPLG